MIHHSEFKITNMKYVSSSIGRAAVSKTAGWGFESLLTCLRAEVLTFVEHQLESERFGTQTCTIKEIS